MSAAVTAQVARGRAARAVAGTPPVALAGIVGPWALAIVAQGTGTAIVQNSIGNSGGSISLAGQSPLTFFCPLHLAAVGGSGLHLGAGPAGSFWLAFALALITWQAMIMAMMLPSSLPLVRLFTVAAAAAPARRRAMLAFLGREPPFGRPSALRPSPFRVATLLHEGSPLPRREDTDPRIDYLFARDLEALRHQSYPTLNMCATDGIAAASTRNSM